ncbi:hypothetical protein [Burkholderia ubonensis]|uniref:hypothetical protein n=1 Tax=Burkholderia ubonensis TaxID=101571 RepID=UPI0012F9B9ED|nr:hypothetical protein [Burkholderia ubonensis]
MLQTALKIYIDGGDRFSVLQLAGAAEELISGHIIQRREYETLASEASTAREKHLETMARFYKAVGQEKTDEEMRDIGRGMNFARNNTKHHDKNQGQILSLDIDAEAYVTLRRAVENYKLYAGELTELMQKFLKLKSPESAFGTTGAAPV